MNVPAYAWGVNAWRVSGIMDNTQWFQIVLGLAPSPPPAGRPALADSHRGRAPAGAVSAK